VRRYFLAHYKIDVPVLCVIDKEIAYHFWAKLGGNGRKDDGKIRK
jgi:hypothetical protein